MIYAFGCGVRVRFALLSIFFAWMLPAADLEQARRLYSLTDFEQSLKVLQAVPARTPEVNLLIGRNLYMLGEYKKATEVLAGVVAAEPRNSDAYLWLGRAWGRRAETSSVLTAPSHASKARQNFERAVELNPRNTEALSDLFEYYLEAPGFLGGGFDKAQAIAGKMAELNPAEGYWAKAKLAEDRKEFGSAEAQLRRAMEAAPKEVGRVIDLVRFLIQQKRYEEAAQSLSAAEKIAPESPRILFERAELYIQQHKNLDVASELLKRYMSSRLTPDDPPRSDAAKLLRQAQGG
jgi:tetratricopeptide (TPR) repeat protein